MLTPVFCGGNMKKQSIADTVAELLAPTVTGLGYCLWDVEYVKEGADWNLTVTIDHPDGITIEDCERVHRAIDPVLDEADPIEDAYILNVSSPGIERVLRTDAHLEAAVGVRVEVRLFAAINGQKALRGTLTAVGDESITLDEQEIPRAAISKVRTVYFE